MELPESCCGKYGFDVEEELTLTPHHTPSQSFDFIVWEKAYLDSIPAAAGSSCGSTHGEGAASARPNASNSSHIECLKPTSFKGPPTKGDAAEASIRDYDFEERRVPLMHTSSESAAPLMAARTDADLPSSFFVYKPGIRCEGGGATSSSSVKEYAPHRSSAGLDEGLTSLEEAVRSYAEGRQRRITVPPSPGTYSNLHGMMIKSSTHGSLQHDSAAHPVINYDKPTAQDHSSRKYVKAVNNEALLKRSLSQPGGGSKGWTLRPTGLQAGVDHHVFDMKSSATMLKPTSKHYSAGHAAGSHPVEFFHDQCSAEQPAQDGAKSSCFPISLIASSPSWQKHGRSSTLDDHEISDIVGKQYSNRVDIHNQDKLMSSTYKPTLYIHQQQEKLPPTTWADFIDMPVGAASRSGGALNEPTMQQHTAGYCRSSFSDISSLSSNDRHAATSAVLSKLKLWGLNHKIKVLCRKFCSSCPNFSLNSSSMSTDFKR